MNACKVRKLQFSSKFYFVEFSLMEKIYFQTLVEEMESQDEAWPFLLPVNTKQFPTYKKIIKCPMDISTIKKRLTDGL